VDRASDTGLGPHRNCLNSLWKVINRERLHRRASSSHPHTYMNDSLELLYSLFDVLCPKFIHVLLHTPGDANEARRDT
jgi:hypothetical protein